MPVGSPAHSGWAVAALCATSLILSEGCTQADIKRDAAIEDGVVESDSALGEGGSSEAGAGDEDADGPLVEADGPADVEGRDGLGGQSGGGGRNAAGGDTASGGRSGGAGGGEAIGGRAGGAGGRSAAGGRGGDTAGANGSGGQKGGAGGEGSRDASVDVGGLGGNPDAPIGGNDSAIYGPDAGFGGASGLATFRVVRIGDGTTTLTSASVPVFVEERRMDGSLVGTLALPTSTSGTTRPLTLSGSATSEGALALSTDGRFLVLAGYATPPKTASVASSAATMAPRVVGRIDAAGTVDTSTVLTTAFDGNNVRGAASLDGAGMWVTGAGSSTGGVWFIPFQGTGGVQVLANPTSVRVPGIFASQLYATSGSGTFANVFSIGSGVPTNQGQMATSLPGMPTSGSPSPQGFVLFDLDTSVRGVDTLYVADDRAPPNGGVQKWKFDGTSWNLVATMTTTPASGVRGLAGFVSGQSVTLIASTSESTANRLVVFVDDGTTPPGQVVATAPPNELFRGVTLSPHE